MTITVHTLTLPSGAKTVIPSRERVERRAAKALKQAGDLESQAASIGEEDVRDLYVKQAESLRASSEKTLAEDAAMRDKLGNLLQCLEFPFQMFTYGQKQAAKARHTTYESGTPRLALDPFFDELAAVAIGMTKETFASLDPHIAEAVREAVIELAEPDEEKADFLSSLLMTSQTGE